MLRIEHAAALAATALALTVSAPAFAQIDAAKAQELMAKGACISCHQVDKKLLGPAYTEVAKKHKGDAKAPDALFAKVRNGGSGVYGPIPMPPNPKEKISDDDLKHLIAWILTL